MSLPSLFRRSAAMKHIHGPFTRYAMKRAVNAHVLFPTANFVENNYPALYEIKVDSYDSATIKAVLNNHIGEVSNKVLGVIGDMALAGCYHNSEHHHVASECDALDYLAESVPIDGARFIQLRWKNVNFLRISKTGNEEMKTAIVLDTVGYQYAVQVETYSAIIATGVIAGVILPSVVNVMCIFLF